MKLQRLLTMSPAELLSRSMQEAFKTLDRVTLNTTELHAYIAQLNSN